MVVEVIKYLEVKHEATEGGDNVGYDLLSRVLVSLGGHLHISRIKCCTSIDKETYGIPELRCIFGSDCIPTVIRGSVIPTRGVNSNRFSCENPGSVFNSMEKRIRIRGANSMQIHGDPDPSHLKFYIRNLRYFLEARQ